MEKKEILDAVKLLRNPIFKKKFPQTFDIVINFSLQKYSRFYYKMHQI